MNNASFTRKVVTPDAERSIYYYRECHAKSARDVLLVQTSGTMIERDDLVRVTASVHIRITMCHGGEQS